MCARTATKQSPIRRVDKSRAVYIERCKYGSGANHGKPAAVRRQGARGLSPLPLMDIQGANLFFQLIARQYEKTSPVFTSSKTFSQWNEVFADVTIASAILDRVLHHCTVINIKGESYRLKERKEFMRQKQQIVNALFVQGST